MLRRPTPVFPKPSHVHLVSKILFFPFVESVASFVRHVTTISHALLVFQITVSLIRSAILQGIAQKALHIMEMAAHNARPTVLLVFQQPCAIIA